MVDSRSRPAGSKSIAECIDWLAANLICTADDSLSAADLLSLQESAIANKRPDIAERVQSAIDLQRGDGRQTSNALSAADLIQEFRVILEGPKAAAQTPAVNSFAADPEMLKEFIAESAEHLAAIETNMLLIGKDPANPEPLNAVFRGFHTIKGLAGFLELGAIQEVAHEIETLLDLTRTRKLAMSSTVSDAVFDTIDLIRTQIDRLRMKLDGEEPHPDSSHALLLARIRAAGQPVSPADTSLAFGNLETPADSTSSLPIQPPAPKPFIERRNSDTSSVRIDTAKLDHLMNMVGEMVIAQTLISHSPDLLRLEDPRLAAGFALLNRITSDVQKITTSMRMVPIGVQFQKTGRLIRDLSRQIGKQVELVTSGDETELDKAIAEELSDPIMHMVRNSIDHGIETPELRESSGKPLIARIGLSAYHQSGQIVIEISDDGRGLDREKILAKAIERGLVRSGDSLSDNEVFLMIFEPGFSTAAAVTGISGRGVGMDVVKKHVQKLRGRIEIQSRHGKGTTFLLKLPLTLAIIEGMVVVVGENRYILPVFSVIELLKPDATAVSQLHGTGELAMVRGGLLPVVRLHERLKLAPHSHQLTDGMLIVCEAQGKQFCLFVDEVIGKQEIVIKSLGEVFRDILGLAGCAILGDGRVGLILDVETLFRGKY